MCRRLDYVLCGDWCRHCWGGGRECGLCVYSWCFPVEDVRQSLSLFLRGSLVGSNSIDAPVACSFHYKLFVDPWVVQPAGWCRTKWMVPLYLSENATQKLYDYFLCIYIIHCTGQEKWFLWHSTNWFAQAGWFLSRLASIMLGIIWAV